MLILKQLRGSSTQNEIAKKLDITTSHYGFIENGERTPSLNLAYKIAKLFNKSMESIFFERKYNNK